MRRVQSWIGILVLALGLTIALPPQITEAAPVFINTATTASNGANTLSVTLPAAATAGNLLIVVCNTNSGTISGPSGFSTAINENTTPMSQGVFYRIAAGGETTLTCTNSVSTFFGIHVYQYSGIDTVAPFVGASSATGNGTAVSSGTINNPGAGALIFAPVGINGRTSFSGWTNSFTERNDFETAQGNPNQRTTYGAADRIVTTSGAYSTVATAANTNTWRGQIIVFQEMTVVPVLSVDIVDAAGNSVASPSASLATVNADFTCQLTTGTLGVSAQRIRITNTTVTPTWTVAVAATSGATAQWTSGTNTYDFNDPSGTPAGCNDGADTDNRPGQLSLNPSVGTITPQSGCTTTGVTRGSSAGFNEGVVNSITLISASSSAQTNCYWDFTGTALSQRIPAGQPTGSYSLNLTLTVTAS